VRTFWLAARVGGFFALLMTVVLVGVSLSGRVYIGKPMQRAGMQIGAADALVIAEALEARLGDLDLGASEVEASVRELAEERRRGLALFDTDGGVIVSTYERDSREPPHWNDEDTAIPCGERQCVATAGIELRFRVPLMRDGQRVGTLEVRTGFPPDPDFRAFERGIAMVGLFALLGIALIALYLTRPIRRMSASMDRIAHGDLDHRVAVKGRDEVTRMAESFNAMTDQLVKIIRGQRELSAGVSHEIRSPLARMKLSIEMLRESGADGARLDALEGEIDALDELVAELLVADRLDIGAAVLEKQELEVRALVDQGWRRAESEAGEELPPLEVDIAAEASTVLADRSYARRIFGNLLENAVRYGGGEPIAVRARREQDRVKITVADRGPGVPAKALDRIFDAFYRVDSSRSRKTGGTGLGLMIVRRAVAAHGGSVEADSPEGSGLAVTFDLPAA